MQVGALWNYESGIPEWLERRLRFDMTFFYLDWKDLQLTIRCRSRAAAQLPFGVQTSVGAHARSEGIETALDVPFTGEVDFERDVDYNAVTDVDTVDPSGTTLPASTRLPARRAAVGQRGVVPARRAVLPVVGAGPGGDARKGPRTEPAERDRHAGRLQADARMALTGAASLRPGDQPRREQPDSLRRRPTATEGIDQPELSGLPLRPAANGDRGVSLKY
jgi:hypothetical protein